MSWVRVSISICAVALRCVCRCVYICLCICVYQCVLVHVHMSWVNVSVRAHARNAGTGKFTHIPRYVYVTKSIHRMQSSPYSCLSLSCALSFPPTLPLSSPPPLLSLAPALTLNTHSLSPSFHPSFFLSFALFRARSLSLKHAHTHTRMHTGCIRGSTRIHRTRGLSPQYVLTRSM